MKDIKELCRIIEEELGKIAEKGLNTGNLETAYKLIDMYKDIKNTEYWDTKADYYMAVLDEMQDGGSSYAMGYDGEYIGRRGRDGRGRYVSRNDGRSYNRGYNDGGYSGRRGRGYSGAEGDDDYDRYMEHKRSYRSGDKDCKQRMIDALERHMDSLTEEVGELARDSDCVEEKKVIERYIDKLKRMM